MAMHEMTGTRPLEFSAWHRTLPERVGMIDVDGVEYDRDTGEPVRVIEVVRGIARGRKSTTVLCKLARRLQVPAYLIKYYLEKGEGNTLSIFKFEVQQVWPRTTPLTKYTPEEFAEYWTRTFDELVAAARSNRGD